MSERTGSLVGYPGSTPEIEGRLTTQARPANAVRYNPAEDEWWVSCERGHVHYGAHGAAGLLLRTWSESGEAWAYLLQQRAAWVDHGGTWGIPSGALREGEDPRVGAIREANEESHTASLHTASLVRWRGRRSRLVERSPRS